MAGLRSMGVAIFAALGFCACAEAHQGDELSRSVEKFIAAIEANDWERAWSLTSSDAQAELLELHGLLHAALETVPLVYPEGQRAQAAAAVGRDVVGDILPGTPGVGTRFMSRILEPAALRFDQQARDGLLSAKAVFAGTRASLVTAAGETFTFVQAPGNDGAPATWRTRAVMDILGASDAVAQLREQAETLLGVKGAHQQAWRTSLDPRQPQGAYNRLQQASRAVPPDVGTIHALLDETARVALEETLKTARRMQRIVQRRSQLGKRAEAYERRGLTMFVRARTDRQLYAAWASTEGWNPPVPDAGEPTRVEVNPTDGSLADVITSSGVRVSMRRGMAGNWQVMGHDVHIRAALLAPLAERLQALRPSP